MIPPSAVTEPASMPQRIAAIRITSKKVMETGGSSWI